MTSSPAKIGKYVVCGELGMGGMARVLDCWDPTLGRAVAVKILREDRPTGPRAKEQFLQEALKIVRLEAHRSIVTVYEADMDGETPFIAMRRIDGATLEKKLKERGVLPFDLTRRVVTAIGNALDFAHRKGILHCDVKPSNILLDQLGQPYLTDFGISRAGPDPFGVEEDRSPGYTPRYASPEQARQEEPTVASDIYSFGIVLYEMVTGSTPFGHIQDRQQLIAAQSLETPTPPSELNEKISKRLDAMICRAIEADPEARYRTVEEMVGAFLRATEEPADASADNVNVKQVPDTTLPREEAPRRSPGALGAAPPICTERKGGQFAASGHHRKPRLGRAWALAAGLVLLLSVGAALAWTVGSKTAERKATEAVGAKPGPEVAAPLAPTPPETTEPRASRPSSASLARASNPSRSAPIREHTASEPEVAIPTSRPMIDRPLPPEASSQPTVTTWTPARTSYRLADPTRFEVVDTTRGRYSDLPILVRDRVHGLELVLIEPGAFVMGSDTGEANERPAHRVAITRPFYLGRTEVTVAMMRTYARSLGLAEDRCPFLQNPIKSRMTAKSYEMLSPSQRWSESHPAGRVDLATALRFCTLYAYRLPTEAEWEFAARAGTTSDTWFEGREPAGKPFEHIDGLTMRSVASAGGAPTVAAPASTLPVGSCAPNPWGLYDMLGNACEWTSDVYSGYSSPQLDAVTFDPHTGTKDLASNEGVGVLRGGAFDLARGDCRVSRRRECAPSTVMTDIGFRVVLEACKARE